MTTPESGPAAWLHILQTSDALYPTGAYAHSLGFEESVRLGQVRDEATLGEFLRLQIVPALAHLTCVMHTKAQIKNILEEIKRRNIRNVLALRGDPPKERPDWKPGEDNFHYSNELVSFMRQNFGDYFGIAVAGFPEGHVLSTDKTQDAVYLKGKVDSGADFIITQLFFDNKEYFDYVARLRKLGVDKRIIPGILPITDYNGLVRFCSTCGASVPQKVHDIFKPIAADPQKTLEAGIKFCVEQCRQLLTLGAPGIHFYTLNKVEPVSTIIKSLR